MVVGYDTFPPSLLLFETHDPIGNGEIYAENPFVTCTEVWGNCGREVVVDVEGSDVGHGSEKLGRAPGGESAQKNVVEGRR